MKAIKFRLYKGTHGNQGVFRTMTHYTDGTYKTRRFRDKAIVPRWASAIRYAEPIGNTEFGEVYEVAR